MGYSLRRPGALDARLSPRRLWSFEELGEDCIAPAAAAGIEGSLIELLGAKNLWRF
jgi:hypothetical protein